MENCENKYQKLFVNENEEDQASILLIDSSGSVKNEYKNEISIFDKFEEIIRTFKNKEHRVIFWNSNKSDKGNVTFFENGIYKIPFIVKQESQIKQLFKLVKTNINEYCLTCPHLAFGAINQDWLIPNKKITIRLITDGQIGWNNCLILNELKNDTKKEILNLFLKHPNVQLEIIAVESNYRDFTNIETLNIAAGCDIYDVIQSGNLTKKISKFISYTPNNDNGFVHIKNKTPLPGHLSYQDKDFSVMNIPLFINYIMEEVKNNKENEDKLLQMIQDLSHTLTIMTLDKPENIRNNNIKIFSDMFKNTKLDSMLVDMLLKDSIMKANMGQAQVFASYRNNLKNLYKEANNLLLKNVKEAIGIRNNFITIPYNDVPIIMGSSKIVDEKIPIMGKTYLDCGIKLDEIKIPVLTAIDNDNLLPLMNQQCLRQWTRTLIGKIYQVSSMEDIVIHVVLGLTLQIILSNGNNTVVDYYKRLCLVMLNKKRMNTDKTEFENILEGNLPLPNDGKLDKLFNDLNKVKSFLELKVEPLTLWYAMCLTLKIDDNEKKTKFLSTQLIHCYDSIKKDFNDCQPNDLLMIMKNVQFKKVDVYNIPMEMCMDYKCPITLDDTSNEGGWMCQPHTTVSGELCSPTFVMSYVGYNEFIKNDNTRMCPYCYTFLQKEDITLVDKKMNTIQPPNINNIKNDLFTEKKLYQKENIINNLNNNANDNSNKKSGGILITMRGEVGSGKSTLSKLIQEKIHELGGKCYVEGTDKYRKNGLDHQSAVQQVRNQLLIAKNDLTELKVVIIDTCGEGNLDGDMFEVSFPKDTWKRIKITPNYIKNQNLGYFAWSLRNVLKRGNPSAENDHFLSPTTAGLDACLIVHKKKGLSLFGKNKYVIPDNLTTNSLEQTISQLNEIANEYQIKLINEMPLDQQVNDIIKKIMNSKINVNQQLA